ncbi:uncharacterized protein LOC114930187 [Nylanderia fulva]|uniref:uncharacterized protein LOC114930187 n=1 Tax=Nylanderia fulva TaxID=613905 RepID=UPI0010FAE678|nr:uncharacterized protein LOC114930187 [Nylanderia fulva]
MDEESEEQDENEEETVAAAVRSGSRNRVVRSGYVPSGGKVGERERREEEVARIRGTEECEDESTEPLQYYEYETEVRNVAFQSGDKCREEFLVKMLGASLFLLLLT